MGIFDKFKIGFKKSASAFSSGLKEIIIKKEIDDQNLNKIEEFLIQSDVGVEAASEIKEIIYHGDHARVRLNLLGNKEFILKVPNSSSRLDIKRGNEINVGWNSHDARALDPKSI